MTNPNYTAICLLADRSGSMEQIRADAEGGINTLVKDQAGVDGDCTIRICQFDTTYEVVTSSTPAKDVPPYVLTPRGGTALNDAFGRTIVEFGEELAAMPEAERPGKVAVVVVTDGQENSSHEWTKQQVLDLVKKQTDDYGWEFMFLAANVDAFAEGAQYGVARGTTRSYDATADGTQAVYATASASLGNWRNEAAGKGSSLTSNMTDVPPDSKRSDLTPDDPQDEEEVSAQ